jgi:sorbitol-specific phosphotransferase system component IIBC
MVQVGTIEYEAVVTGADEAQNQADDVNTSFTQMGEQAQDTADSTGFLGAALGSTVGSLNDAGDEADDTDTKFTLLKSTVGALAGRLAGITGLGGILSGLGGFSLGSLLSTAGGVSLGSLISKAAFATLLKGTAALSALVIAADTIAALINGEDPVTAFVTSVEDFGEFLLNPLGLHNDIIERVAGIGAFILGTMSIISFITGVPIAAMISGAGATIASFLGVSSLTGLVTGAGATIASFLGFASLGSLVLAVGSIAALIVGVISLADLVDGNISSWNLPAKFGRALGQGFARAWPDMAEKIHSAFTNNPIHGAGEFTGNVIRGEGQGAVEGDNRELSADADTGFIDPRETPGLSQAYDAGQAVGDFLGGEQGARIQSEGLMRVHEGEELVPADVTRDLQMVDNIQSLGGGGGGGGGESNVTQVDQVNVDLSGDFDPSNLSRRQLNRLADDLVDRIGAKANQKAGSR